MYHREYCDDDKIKTLTSEDQKKIEGICTKYMYPYRQNQRTLFNEIKLLKRDHKDYIFSGLDFLTSGYQSLDASRPWLCYWCVHALDVLGALDQETSGTIDKENRRKLNMDGRVTDFLSQRCQNFSLNDQSFMDNQFSSFNHGHQHTKTNYSGKGGFAGGPSQLSHLAPTYASVNSLIILEQYDKINREELYQWLLHLKCPVTGGFRMHHDGEVDVRGCYTALSVAYLLNILTDELCEGVDTYVFDCQTYEGGIGAYPGCEAHGGYTFCGLASMFILNKVHLLDMDRLIHWACMRQMSFEGGFQGRTNKLVDSCYSFWVGSLFPLIYHYCCMKKEQKSFHPLQEYFIQQYLQIREPDAMSPNQLKKLKNEYVGVLFEREKAIEEETTLDEEQHASEKHFPQLHQTEWLMDQTALQEYVMLCCQYKSGGLRDKPSKSRDFYHTCYSLSGISICQHGKINTSSEKDLFEPLCIGSSSNNSLKSVNPIFNISRKKVEACILHFKLCNKHE